MLEPPEMMAEPCRRLAKLARTRSTSITFMGRRNSLVDILGAVAANLATDRRGMHATRFAMLAWLSALKPQSGNVVPESAAGNA